MIHLRGRARERWNPSKWSVPKKEFASTELPAVRFNLEGEPAGNDSAPGLMTVQVAGGPLPNL